MAVVIIRDLGRELAHEVWALGPRANEVHLAFQDVPKLRYLVHPQLTDHLTDTRDTLVVRHSPDGRAVGLRVIFHRPEFYDAKNFTVLPDSFLLVKERAARLKF